MVEVLSCEHGPRGGAATRARLCKRLLGVCLLLLGVLAIAPAAPAGAAVIGEPLTVAKDATGAYKQTYAWDIAEGAEKTLIKRVGGEATFSFRVEVGHDSGAVGDVGVSGTITVTNPNVDADGATVAVGGVDVADQLSDGTTCTVTDGSNVTLTASETTFAYACSLTSLPSGDLANTVSVTWPTQFLDNGALLPAPATPATYTLQPIDFARSSIDECIDVTDTYAGALGPVCVGDPNRRSFAFERAIPVPANGCELYDNSASYETNDTAASESDGETVTVCGPVKTGAATIGFWQSSDGQAIIRGGASDGTVCTAGRWLRQYTPFRDLSPAASCGTVATYLTNVIKTATCPATTSTCNAMLKAQMLATALDVYFSDPALGTDKIGAPAPLGGVQIDLTRVCATFSGSGASATCSTYEDAGNAFGGATSLSVSDMLAYAASRSNVSGSIWYDQIKATQVLAKDAFDAVNNEVAFGT